MPNDSFQTIWNEAIRNYQTLTGTDIAEKMDDVSNVHTADDLLRRLDQAQDGFKSYRKRGENVRHVLEPMLVIVRAFSDTIGHAVGMVCTAVQTKLLVLKMVLLGIPARKGNYRRHTTDV